MYIGKRRHLAFWRYEKVKVVIIDIKEKVKVFALESLRIEICFPRGYTSILLFLNQSFVLIYF